MNKSLKARIDLANKWIKFAQRHGVWGEGYFGSTWPVHIEYTHLIDVSPKGNRATVRYDDHTGRGPHRESYNLNDEYSVGDLRHEISNYIIKAIKNGAKSDGVPLPKFNPRRLRKNPRAGRYVVYVSDTGTSRGRVVGTIVFGPDPDGYPETPQSIARNVYGHLRKTARSRVHVKYEDEASERDLELAREREWKNRNLNNPRRRRNPQVDLPGMRVRGRTKAGHGVALTKRSNPRKLSYREARFEMWQALGDAGWDMSRPNLKVAHATWQNRVRLWLKPQSILVERGGAPWRMGVAHALVYGLDLRQVSDFPAFVRAVERRLGL